MIPVGEGQHHTPSPRGKRIAGLGRIGGSLPLSHARRAGKTIDLRSRDPVFLLSPRNLFSWRHDEPPTRNTPGRSKIPPDSASPNRMIPRPLHGNPNGSGEDNSAGEDILRPTHLRSRQDLPGDTPLFSRVERIVFWVGVLALGAIWCGLPIRRDQAALLLRGWYPGWARLCRDSSPDALARARELERCLLARFWLTNDETAPDALSGGFAWAGRKGEEHFRDVLVPQLTTWIKRREAARRDLPPWKALFSTDPATVKSGQFSLARIEAMGVTLLPAEGGGIAFQRTDSRASLLIIFSPPPLPSRIGDGLAFDMELEGEGETANRTPWRLLWATPGTPGFEEPRNLLIAPRQKPGEKQVRLVGDFRSIPEWIADEPVLALRLELPPGESPRGGVIRCVYAAVFSAPRAGVQCMASPIGLSISQELHDL